jgi:prolipoprotein diacylglyceryltransferase
MLVLASSLDVKGSIDKALISFSALRGGVSIHGGCVVGVGGGVCLALSSMFDVYEYMIRGISDVAK